MRNLVIAAGAAAVALVLVPRIEAQQPTAVANDQLFAMAAGAGGQAEVAAAKIATQRATRQEVKQLAQQLIDDHTRSNQELMALASARRITMPGNLDIKDQACLARLNGLQGEEFDREFLKQQRLAHMETIALFEGESQHGRDPQLKTFASQSLPKLKEHLQRVEQLEGQSGGNGNEPRRSAETKSPERPSR